jgi:HPt (histidine-containing phosphotransfer) domain-containing protein
MSYDPGALDSALAAAVGDDSALQAELRGAFLDSARRQLEGLRHAGGPGDWRIAAWRLKGLAASFGVTDMMALSETAADAAPRDPETLRRIERALAALEQAHIDAA